MVPGGVSYFVWQVSFARSGLLQAQNVGGGLGQPVQKALFVHGPDSIDVPRQQGDFFCHSSSASAWHGDAGPHSWERAPIVLPGWSSRKWMIASLCLSCF